MAGFVSASGQLLSVTVAIPLAFTAVLEQISRYEQPATKVAEDTAHPRRMHNADNRINAYSAFYATSR